jgi:hypothetical protein
VNNTVLQPGNSRVWGIEKTWQENWENGHQVKYDHTMCEKDDGTGKKKRESVSPGNERTRTQYGRTKIWPDEESIKNKYKLGPKGCMVTMMPMKGGYLISASVEQFLDYSHDTEQLDTEVCSGKRKSSKTTARTVPFSQKPASSVSGSEDNKIYHLESNPMYSTSFAFSKHFVLSEGQELIEGTETLVDVKAEKPGDWNRNTVVTWRIRMKNYCDDVYDALYTDLSLAEAYNDPNLRNQAGNDVEAYEKMVSQKAAQTYRSNNPDPDRFTGIRMSVNPKCEIDGMDEAKESLRERCLPDVIYDATHAHESRHVSQCELDPEMFPMTVDKMGPYETDGYIAGIRVYIDWLEANCKNDHRLSVAKDRLAALMANRTR